MPAAALLALQDPDADDDLLLRLHVQHERYRKMHFMHGALATPMLLVLAWHVASVGSACSACLRLLPALPALCTCCKGCWLPIHSSPCLVPPGRPI